MPSLSSLPHRIALTFVFRTSPSEALFCPVHREHFLQVLHGETFGTVCFLKINVIGGRGFLLRAVLVINWKLKNKHYVLVFVKLACRESFAGALCLWGTVWDVSPLPSPEVPSGMISLPARGRMELWSRGSREQRVWVRSAYNSEKPSSSPPAQVWLYHTLSCAGVPGIAARLCHALCSPADVTHHASFQAVLGRR